MRTALQLFYTSCRRGISGHAGFQTRAVSDGVKPDEIREIEACALYQAPRELPTSPDADTLASMFPKAFRAFRLASGRIALLRTVYAGQDYSGRWGNYFTHALVMEHLPRGHWPIDVYAWDGWRDRLESPDDSEPQALEPVDLERIGCGQDFSLQEIGTFLGEEPSRPALLRQMIQAVFGRATESRSLVIRAGLELDGVYWIACLQKAFPLACLKNLSCSTYQFDPRTCLAVNATMGETDFLFDEGERRYQFYQFDCIAGVHSEVPADGIEYARVLSEWMASQPARVEGFHEFAGLFACDEIGPELLHVLRLYRVSLSDNLERSSSELGASLAFAQAKALPRALPRVLGAVGDVTRALNSQASPEDWRSIVRFLAQSAVAADSAELRARVACAWVKAFDTFVLEHHRWEDAILALRDETESGLGKEARVVSEAFVEDVHLDWMLQRAAKLPTRNLELLVTALLHALQRLGREHVNETQEVRSLIEAAMSRRKLQQAAEVRCLLSPFRGDLRALEDVTSQVACALRGTDAASAETRAGYRIVGAALSDILGGGDESARFELLGRLEKSEGLAFVLVGEWEATLARASDKVGAHARYEAGLLADGSTFATAMAETLAKTLLEQLPARSVPEQAQRWESGRCGVFSGELAQIIVEQASRRVTFSADDEDGSEKLVRLIGADRKSRGIRGVPIRCELFNIARRVRQGERLELDRATFEPAGSEGYREFLTALFPGLLNSAHSAESYCRALLTLYLASYGRTFTSTYVRYIGALPGERFDDADRAALCFWIGLKPSDSQGGSAWLLLERMREEVVDALALRAAELRGVGWTLFEQFMGERRESKGRARSGWDVFRERVARRRTGWIGRLLGF